MAIENKQGIQPNIRDHFGLVTGAGQFVIPVGVPANATQAIAIISDDVMGALNVGATVTVETIAQGTTVFTRVGAAPGANEFTDAVELGLLIDTVMEDWDAVENTGAVDITATEGGAMFNGHNFIVENVEDTTANGAVATQADATITAGAVAAMALGDTVEFDGEVYTLVAAAVAPNDFEDLAGLMALIDATADWDATIPVADIVIESTVVGAEWNGYDVVITYNHETAGADNGTPATIGAMMTDGERLYISTATAGFNNMSWERTPDLLFATY